MHFDAQTLFFTNVAVLFVAAFMAFLYWLRTPDQVALRIWAAAMGSGGVGTLIVGLFGPVPGMAPSLIGNAFIVTGVVLAWECMRRFNGRPPGYDRVVGSIVTFMLVFGAAWLMGADLRVRVFIGSLTLALFTSLASREIAMGGRHERLSGRATTAVIFGIVALDMVIRAVDAVLGPPVARDLAFFQEPVQGHTLFAMTIGLVCLSISGLSTMVHERLLHRYERLALTDELTELPNRRFFMEHAERVAKRVTGDARPASLLMMDLDNFSEINESFGHSGGDEALVAFAIALRSHVRPTDLVARYGGEEFCALLVDTDLPHAKEAAERLRAAIESLTVEVKGRPLSFTVSIGIALLQGTDIDAALDRADRALYQAKHEGRNRVAVAS
ncbi:MAG: GGDEF domain-containing protein [Alphaproteobacteria bacterium]|nr:GGDEF domain-containing protein [Alphaproteobacteria bacterium]